MSRVTLAGNVKIAGEAVADAYVLLGWGHAAAVNKPYRLVLCIDPGYLISFFMLDKTRTPFSFVENWTPGFFSS